MAGILFPINQALLEIESAKAIARQFLENEETTFAQMRTQLEGLRDEPSIGHLKWKIPAEQPLRTVVSEGEYERSGKGDDVMGTLSFLWEIDRVHPRRRRAAAQQFRVVGIASTVLRVFAVEEDGSQGEELAMWRMEVGDDNSPGCHFHVQIRGENDHGPFPGTLSIPRLPGCVVTPMAALEFLLAELFQERWRRHVFSDTDALRRWRSIQRARFTKVFAWHQGAVLFNGLSPWCALKIAKPPQNLFLD